MIEEEEINHLRNLIESSFSKKNYPRGISVFDLENEEAITIILNRYFNFLLTLEQTNSYIQTLVSISLLVTTFKRS